MLRTAVRDTARRSVRALAIAVALLAHSLPVLAWETRILPELQQVSPHARVVVSALPTAGVAGDVESTRIRIQPRRRPDPEGLRAFKRSLEAPPEPLVVPEAPLPRADVSAPLATMAFEGLANLPDNAISGFSVAPSDATLAVGPSHVFQVVNIVGRIANKSGGAVATFTLRSFFQIDAGADETDPRVIFDASSQRWFASVLQFSTSKPQRSSVILAVSATSDPTGLFCTFRLGNPTAETFFQDFPQLGIDDHKLIVTYSGFTFGDKFLGAGYYAVNKAALIQSASSGCQPQSVPMVRVAPNLDRFGIYPAQSLSSTGRLYMAMHGDGFTPSNQLLLFAVDGQPGVTMLTENTTVLSINLWSPPPDAVQAGSSGRLATNDASVITAVWQRGSLWIGGNESCVPSGEVSATPRSCLRLIQIQTDLVSVQQDIAFGAPGRYYSYPALSPDVAGNLFVAFNGSSSSEFGGVRVTGRRVTDPPNTLAAATLLRAGGGPQIGSNRMGDYYGAALDPEDPGVVWVTAEYIRTGSPLDWGTYVARLAFSPVPPPTLALTPNATTFRAGDPLIVSLTVSNPGSALLVDAYFGILLPPAAGPGFGCLLGGAVVFATGSLSSSVIRCLSDSPATFPRLAANASIPAGLPATTFPGFLSLVWPMAPAGDYVVFIAFTNPGALVHGAFIPADVSADAETSLTFIP